VVHNTERGQRSAGLFSLVLCLSMDNRCGWSSSNEQMITYHDTEGVSRSTRPATLRQARAGRISGGPLLGHQSCASATRSSAPSKASTPTRWRRYARARVAKILRDPGIVRTSRRSNPRSATRAPPENEGRGPSHSIRFSGNSWRQPKVNAWKTLRGIPAETKESIALSKALVERGFRLWDRRSCTRSLQAVGMVNDHLVSCFR